MIKTHVIIAHYNENLDWTKNLIYQKNLHQIKDMKHLHI